ncbi:MULTISPECIES: hypothetical protein [Pseudomonas]|uniref:hypothetical protein n=1 Tax=Pseudomonas TaxID=286 RepID=UPI0011B2983C|nr:MULTISPECIES: hypothetical protein [Pseudomonas]MDM9556412.1 hypothetical protein [Pseudomonas asiatica]
MYNLTFIPFPFTEESPLNMIRRTAATNGYQSIHKFLSTGLLGFRLESHYARPYSTNSTIAKYLRAEAGPYAERVMAGFYQAPDNRKQTVRIGTIEVANLLLRHHEVAFCDHCAARGQGYFIADLRCSYHCPYHNRVYLFHCPHCGYAFDWRDPMDGVCSACEHQLCCEPCSDTECQLERTLLNFFRSQDQQSLNNFLLICRSLGAPFAPGGLPYSEHSGIFRAAMAIFNKDVKALTAYLSGLRAKYPAVENRWIIARLGLVDNDISRQAIGRFNRLENHNSTFLERIIATPIPLTYNQIRQELGVGQSKMITLRKLANRSAPPLFQELNSNDANALWNIENHLKATKNGRLPTEPEQLVSSKQLQSDLKIDSRAVYDLIKKGILPYFGSAKAPYFTQATALSFEHKYQSLCRLQEQTGENFRCLLYYLRKMGIEPAIKLTNRLENWLYNRKDVLGIIAPTNQIHTFKSKLFSLPTANFNTHPKSDFLCTSKAARSLKLGNEHIFDAIKKGIFKNAWKDRRGCVLLLKTEIQQFLKDYCRLKDAFPNMQHSHQEVKKFLATHNAHFVTFEADGWTQTWVKVSDVSRIIKLINPRACESKRILYSCGGVADRLKVTTEIVKVFARTGLLKRLTFTSPPLFSERSIKDFEDKYITSREILHAHGLYANQTNKLIAALSKLHLNPIVTTGSPLVAIYDRKIYSKYNLHLSLSTTNPSAFYFSLA